MHFILPDDIFYLHYNPTYKTLSIKLNFKFRNNLLHLLLLYDESKKQSPQQTKQSVPTIQLGHLTRRLFNSQEN